MSHVSKTESQMKEIGIIKSALKDLGISYLEGSVLIGKYITNSKTKADLVLNHDGDQSIGLNKNAEGIYDFIGDIDMKSNFTNLKDRIEQRYSARLIKKNLSRMNVQGTKERVLEDGTIRLTATVA